MKSYKIIVLLGVLAIGLYSWYYISTPADSSKPSHLSGVIITAPPEFFVVATENPGEDLSTQEAADEIENILIKYPAPGRIGLKYSSGGGDAYLLVDRYEETIQQLAANANGTAVQTTWKGNIDQRIQWCKEHGDFTVEGLPEPITRNLYH